MTTQIRSSATYGALAEKVAKLMTDGKNSDSDEWKAVAKEATEYRPTGVVVSGPYVIDPARVFASSVRRPMVAPRFTLIMTPLPLTRRKSAKPSPIPSSVIRTAKSRWVIPA